MLPFRYVAVFAVLALATAQDFEYEARPAPARIQPGFSGQVNAKPTPVPILKQINRHNEDGSYTYGYEGADGSFKIETKLPTGEVKGKYGYVDDTGKVRVVEYGATKYGFEPSGEGITVAPPTIVDETTDKNGNQIQFEEYDQPQQQQQLQPARPRAPAPQRYEPAPQYQPQQFAPVTSRSSAVPQRASPISNFGFAAQPARSFAPAPQPQRPSPSYSFSNAAPAPIEEDNYEAPQPRPLPKITYAQPRPQQQQFGFAPANTQAITRPQPQHQPQPQQQQFAPQPRPVQRPAGGRGGVLDQLAKDYALPSGGAAALHDISFGYY